MRLMSRVAALTAMTVTPALAAPPAIIADTPITGSLVQQVLGDLGQVQVLLPSGTSPHGYQLRPSDAAGLQDADLLVWVGPELTPWLQRPAATLAADAVELRLLAVAGTQRHGFADPEDHEEHSADTGHADHADEEGHDGHDHAGIDPHAWLDPDNGRVWLTAIAGQLAQIDPDNAGVYQGNARQASEGLAELDATIARDLAPVAGRPFVVMHDAYGYFTRHFGLPPAIALSLGDATSPSAARLAEVREIIRDSGATCAFAEIGQDPGLLETMIENTKVRMGNPLAPEGGDIPAGPQLYETVLRRIADHLIHCHAAR